MYDSHLLYCSKFKKYRPVKQQLDESRSEAAKFRIGAEILARDNDELRQNEGKLRDDIRRLSGF